MLQSRKSPFNNRSLLPKKMMTSLLHPLTLQDLRKSKTQVLSMETESLEVCRKTVLCSLLALLTAIGDLFDEADFGVAANGNPDEVTLGPDAHQKPQPPTPAVDGQNAQPRPPVNMPGPPGRPNPAVVTPSKPEKPWDPAQAPRQVPPALNGRPNPPTSHDPNLGQRRPIPAPAPPQNFQNGTTAPSGPQRPNQDLSSLNGAAQAPVKREFGPNAEMPPPNGSPSTSFFSARAVDMLKDISNPPSAAPQFDLHAQSPSIRKTAGVDHTKSVPISKPMVAGVSPAPNNTRDFINPSTDMNRKIGAPGGGGFGSPMNRGQMTSSYRPLTRPNVDPRAGANPALQNRGSAGLQNMNLNGKRPPLNDVTNATTASGGNGAAPMLGAVDPKRPRFNAGDPNPQQQAQAPQQQ